MQYYTILYYTILAYTMQYYTILCNTIPYYAISHYQYHNMQDRTLTCSARLKCSPPLRDLKDCSLRPPGVAASSLISARESDDSRVEADRLE